jgi:beta-phosphoglucomutase-like phosphatase (HAD superfamily)
MDRKKGVIFDMDGVLEDAMPFHCEAIKAAAKQESNIDVEQRDVYLLEGMPGEDMVKKLLRLKGYTDNKKGTDDDDNNKLESVADKIHERKKKNLNKLMLQDPFMAPKS